jgi:ankyrin repeat protein
MELDGEGRTGLHCACRNRGKEAQSIFFACLTSDVCGTPADRGNLGDLPLHVACSQTPCLGIVKELVARHPAAVQEIDNDRDLPLHRAVVNTTSAGPEIVEYILGLSPQAVSRPGSQGESPLHKACAASPHLAVVCRLLEVYPQGAQVQAGPGHFRGDFPAHRAACNQHYQAAEILRTILAARPEAAGEGGFLGRLPLHIACSEGRAVEVVEEAISFAKDVAAFGVLTADEEQDSALHRAMYNQHAPAQLAIVECLLLVEPKSTQARGYENMLPFHSACKYATKEVVERLLGADRPSELDMQRGWEICQARQGSGLGIAAMIQQRVQTEPVVGAKGRSTRGNSSQLDALLDQHMRRTMRSP